MGSSLPRASSLLVLPLWLASMLAGAPSARAQQCHASAAFSEVASDAPREARLTLRAGAASVLGTYDNAAGHGDYQGVGPALSLAHPRFALQSSILAYRLYDGEAHHGIGDLGSELRVVAYRTSDAELGLALGPELGATFPTGTERKGMGMGHTMLMPGAWLALSSSRFEALLRIAYGRALGNMGAHAAHGGGLHPLVDPMNASELEQLLRLAYAASGGLRVLASFGGAVPVDEVHGAAREAFGVGVQARFDRFDAGAELQLPIVGEAFSSRVLLSLGASF